ncbi:aminotransferase class V-fold PLP-dependent enzyme [Tenggerimyces flavus]|uniref:Aminotransferase class V-fold PLP-dependent enzyme n=1 Tax=Tenggerimyces flavus TaxID=1708749 RepID=A0ABV7YRQ5_9ACTN|nr:aminotransferase class V-fold PLP-dependent enzyme [Tenggerimyces flavus]MBM7784462.1 selenocysteine lyase/cysteine desulfurase [Tenggerimyces flavus]
MTALDTRPETCPATATSAATTAQPLLPVVGGDLSVPLVTGEWRRYVNLDYAASAPSLKSVAEHLNEVLPYYASVHRGAGYASQVSTRLYESARTTVAEFLNAREDDVVVFTRNTTDALNLLATCLPNDDGVVFLDIEHHANLLPWQRVNHRCVLAGTTQNATLIALRAELHARKASLVAVTGASNVTGELLPLQQIVEIAHAAGARVVLDAAQLAPHRRIDLEETGVDYVAFSGHKLYAPHGAGVLVGRRDWLDEAPAYLAGGGAVREVTVASTQWADAPQRHEGGTPNVLGAVALARACTAIADLEEGALEEHESALRDRLLDRLALLDHIKVHQIWRDSPDSIGVVAFSVDGYHPGFVAAYLSAEHGIGVRDGKFCAHPLLSRLGANDGAVRASFGAGSTTADVDRLADALDALLTRGPRWTYDTVEGRWAPSPDPRPTPEWLDDDAPVATGTAPCESEPAW